MSIDIVHKFEKNQMIFIGVRDRMPSKFRKFSYLRTITLEHHADNTHFSYLVEIVSINIVLKFENNQIIFIGARDRTPSAFEKIQLSEAIILEWLFRQNPFYNLVQILCP